MNKVGIQDGCYYNYAERPNWKRSIYGRLALAGATVGYGSVVYFPHNFMKYRIVYLFPYLIFWILVGIPLFTFELAMGQYLNIGPIKGFSRLSPILSGLGWGMVMTSLITSIYYNLYLAYSMILFVKQTAYFFDSIENEDTMCNINFQLYKNHDNQVTLNIYGELLVAFALCWIIVAVCLFRGYQSSSRMIVFINVLPFYLLLILVILKAYYSTSEETVFSVPHDLWQNISSSSLWLDSFKQVLFTLGIGFGVTSTMASYNKAANHKFLLDIIAIPLIDFVTSLLCVYLIYGNLQPDCESILGVLCTFAKKIKGDETNVFIYLIFFMMGLSCQLAMVETVMIAILDQYNRLRNYHFYVVILCLILALTGGYMCINTDLYNALSMAGENLFMFFSLILAWSGPIFHIKFKKIKQDLNLEISKIFETYLTVSWCFFCPVILTVGTIANFVMKTESLQSANILSAAMVLLSVSFSVYKIYKLKFKECFQSTKDFCMYEERSRTLPNFCVSRGSFQIDVPP